MMIITSCESCKPIQSEADVCETQDDFMCSYQQKAAEDKLTSSLLSIETTTLSTEENCSEISLENGKFKHSTEDKFSSYDSQENSEQTPKLSNTYVVSDVGAPLKNSSQTYQENEQIPSEQPKLLRHEEGNTSSAYAVFNNAELVNKLDIKPGEYVTFEAWETWLQRLIKWLGGWSVVEGSWVKPGNNQLSRDSIGQRKLKRRQYRAQYGRANPILIEKAINAAMLTEDDKFIDVGSGIGQVVFQVACTVGCEAIGIELIPGRHACATQLKEYFDGFLRETGALAGDVSLILGDFTDSKYIDLLSGCSVFFVNNAEGTFGSRCVEGGMKTLDYYITNYAKLARIGSRVITFDPLLDLESPELGDVFIREDVDIGPGATCWTEKGSTSVKLHIYKKERRFWTCRKCTFSENPLVVQLNGEFQPQDKCLLCSDDPAGMARSYSLRRARKKRKAG